MCKCPCSPEQLDARINLILDAREEENSLAFNAEWARFNERAAQIIRGSAKAARLLLRGNPSPDG
jgi:hypothetical protein